MILTKCKLFVLAWKKKVLNPAKTFSLDGQRSCNHQIDRSNLLWKIVYLLCTIRHQLNGLLSSNLIILSSTFTRLLVQNRIKDSDCTRTIITFIFVASITSRNSPVTLIRYKNYSCYNCNKKAIVC